MVYVKKEMKSFRSRCRVRRRSPGGEEKTGCACRHEAAERKDTMRSIYIKLNTIDDVYTLVQTLVAYDGDVDLESGRYKVDGKSLLGVFSLDLRHPIKLTFHDETKADALFKDISALVVENVD